MIDEEESEPRIIKRRHLVYYLEVYNAETNDLLGNLVDITTRGCKIVSRKPIPRNKTMMLKLILPEGFFHESELVFEAKSVWSANDINPEFFDTGFEVPYLGLEPRKVIRRLIERVGFND